MPVSLMLQSCGNVGGNADDRSGDLVCGDLMYAIPWIDLLSTFAVPMVCGPKNVCLRIACVLTA